MEISILGAGYVGLVTAGCLARLGNTVRLVDIDGERIARLEHGEMPIDEPGLAELMAEGVAAGRLAFHADPASTHGTALVIIAVGTLDGDGRWTADYVRSATLDLARDSEAPRDIVVRSTLMPGTAAGLRAAAREIDPAIELAHNPEFTREGQAIGDFMKPDRVVVGVFEPDLASTVGTNLDELYRPLGAPIVTTDLTSAETIKVASNVFLAAKIAYANELARICAATGADIYAVVDGMGLDRRIGRSFLSPGPGFGGSCFPSQAVALPEFAHGLGIRPQLMEAIAASNDEQARWCVRQLTAELGGSLSGRRICVLGLTYKAGTDDLRDSPALRLVRLLHDEGASVAAFDPSGADRAVRMLATEGVAIDDAGDPVAAASGADAVLVATEWPPFKSLDWAAMGKAMRGSLVFDTRNIVDGVAASAAGLTVSTIGR